METHHFRYQRLLQNADKAYHNAKSEWAKKYWLEVMEKLSQNMVKN